MPSYRRLIGIAVVLTFGLLMLGAYVRLSDAGLGCPDWPGCYGALSPSHAREQINQAVAEQGGTHGPVSMGKAWREMAHRYTASLLGLLIIGIAWIAVRRRRELGQAPWLAVSLVGVVILQGLFGKWTVTLLLVPAIVTGHLIGGLVTFVLLLWLWLRQRPGAVVAVGQQPAPVPLSAPALNPPLASLRAPALIGLVLLCGQILLGGWTSTNYAALACPDLPTCQGAWWPPANFSAAFHLFRELGRTGDGAMLPAQALTAIHLSHRIGALVVTVYTLWLIPRVRAVPALRKLGVALAIALAAQLVLGISNVLFGLPLAVAVAHNAGAAALLAVYVVINYRAGQARPVDRPGVLLHPQL